jgi:hypothetical protein
MLILPIMVFAEGENNTLVGNDLTSPGAKLAIDIKVSSNITFNKYEADLSYETNVLELVGIENKGSWDSRNELTSKSPLSLKFEHDGYSGETTIATINFKVKPDATKAETRVSIVGKITQKSGGEDDNGTIINLEEASKTIQIKSTDNTLKDLKVNNETVVNFSPSTYSYSMQVDSNVTNAEIGATLNNTTATFVDQFGPRNVGLEYGENKIEIKVKSASGEDKTYVINITRNDNRGSNNNLKNIIINSGDVKINFDQNTLEYRIKTYKLQKIDVVCETVDPKAKCEVKANATPEVGPNNIEILVTSEDGKTKTYKIVLDNQDRELNVTLKSIQVLAKGESIELSPQFKSDILDYEIKFNPKYSGNLVIIPEVSSKEDEVKYDEALLGSTLENLKVGSEVKIRVYAPDGTENLYTITFIKDDRINFYTILFGVILVILLVIFIKLIIDRTKLNKNIPVTEDNENVKVYKKESEKELMKTKRLNKINLE